MSYELRDRMAAAARNVYKLPTIPEEVLAYREPVDTTDLLSGLTLKKLNTIFQSVIRRQEDKVDPIRSKFGKIEKEEVSLPDKMEEVRENMPENTDISVSGIYSAGRPARCRLLLPFWLFWN